jgi:hypothetical protein
MIEDEIGSEGPEFGVLALEAVAFGGTWGRIKKSMGWSVLRFVTLVSVLR